MNKRCLTWLIWSGWLWAALVAQEVPPMVHFSPPNLSAQPQNWMVAQAEDGSMWLANSSGLLHFDGQHWQRYSLPQGQIVRAVALDQDGRVFVGGYGEFGYWQPDERGRLHYHSLSRLVPEGLAANEEIWHILVREDGVLLQSFATLFWYDYQTLHRYPSPHGHSLRFVQEVNGQWLLPIEEEGIYTLDLSAQALDLQLLPGSEAFADRHVVGIVPSPAGGLLICTARDGIFEKNGDRYQLWGEGALQDLWQGDQLNRVLRLQDGRYAWGTILDGLWITDAQGQQRYHLNQETGLQNNTVLALHEDHRGQLWVGLDHGLDLIDLHSPVLHYRDPRGKLGAVYTAAQYRGRLYLGTNHGVFVAPRQQTGEFELLSGTQGQVWDLRVAQGELLIGHNDGTFAWNGRRLYQVSTRNGGWCTLPRPGRPQELLQGTYGGLSLLRYESRRGWYEAYALSGLGQSVKQMVLAETGGIWAVHPYQGAYYLELDENWRAVTQLTPLHDSLALPTLFNLRTMSLGELDLLRADTAFYVLGPEAGGLRRWQPPQWLQSDPCRYLWRSQQGDTLAVFPDRVVRASARGRQTFSLQLIPDHENLIELAERGYLMCLEAGYARLAAPNATAQPALPPPSPTLRQVETIDSQPRWLMGAAATQRQPVLPLQAEQRHLRFTYSLAHYTDPVRFRYRLRGFSDRWSEWGTATVKEYTNLQPGKYTFEVQADQSDQTAQLDFYLQPPWYQSPYAYAAYALLFMALVYLIFRLHFYRLARHQRRVALQKQREFQQQRMRERNEELQRDIQNKARELANSTMGLMRKNETLLELKEELQQLHQKAASRLPEPTYRQMQRRIEQGLGDEQDWQVFETNFNQVHDQFFQRLKADYPTLTAGDLRLAAFLRMGLSSKEMAPLLHISVRGVENKRYRLRKKMGLQENDTLTDVVMRY